MRCISVHFVDLGPVDALFDPDRQWLVLRPSLTPPERRRAARRVLDQAGVRQPLVGVLVACWCGQEVDVDPLGPSTQRRPHLARTASAAVAVAVGAITAMTCYAGPLTASAFAGPKHRSLDHRGDTTTAVVDRHTWAANHDTFCNRRRGLCYDDHNRDPRHGLR